MVPFGKQGETSGGKSTENCEITCEISIFYHFSLTDQTDTHLLVLGRVPDSDQQASQKEEDDPQREE